MKLENETAYNLARDYLSSHCGGLSEEAYFSKFIQVYEKFDAWLATDDPAKSAKEARKPFPINNDLLR